MSRHTSFKSPQHQQFLMKERINRSAIHAAEFTKFKGGDRLAQDAAASYARRLAETGTTTATAIYHGYRAGLKTMRAQQTQSISIGDHYVTTA